MSEIRKPVYAVWNCGPVIIYPVTVNVGGRLWEEREILVPIGNWKNGERKFGYVHNGHCAGMPEYVPTRKVAEGIQHAVDAVYAYAEALREYNTALERVSVMQDTLSAIADDCIGLSSLMRNFGRR